jgi:hypothetical protein
MKSETLTPKRAIIHLLSPSQKMHPVSIRMDERASQQTTEEINIDEAKARVDMVKAGTVQALRPLTLA